MVVGVPYHLLPSLRWSAAGLTPTRPINDMSHRQRALSPEPFARLLISIAELVDPTLLPPQDPHP